MKKKNEIAFKLQALKTEYMDLVYDQNSNQGAEKTYRRRLDMQARISELEWVMNGDQYDYIASSDGLRCIRVKKPKKGILKYLSEKVAQLKSIEWHAFDFMPVLNLVFAIFDDTPRIKYYALGAYSLIIFLIYLSLFIYAVS